MTSEEEGHVNFPNAKWGLAAILVASPLFFVFAVHGNPAKGRAAMLSAALIIGVVRSWWRLRRHVWFWVTVVGFVGLHMALVSLVHWQEKSYPGFTLLPIGITDFLMMYWIIKLVERLASEGDTESRR